MRLEEDGGVEHREFKDEKQNYLCEAVGLGESYDDTSHEDGAESEKEEIPPLVAILDVKRSVGEYVWRMRVKRPRPIAPHHLNESEGDVCKVGSNGEEGNDG